MASLRQLGRSTRGRAVARILVAAHLFALVPVDASATTTSLVLATERGLAELERPSAAGPFAVATRPASGSDSSVRWRIWLRCSAIRSGASADRRAELS
jgi:hypothetical protein